MRSNQKHACILEASESTRLRMEESLPNYHEDHFVGKGEKFTATLQFGTQNLFLCLKPWRFPQQKQRWIKNRRNWKRFRRGDLTKDRWSKDEGGAKVHFASLMDICHLKNARIGSKAQKNTKVELYSEAILWRMILDLTQHLQNKDHQHHKGQQQKSWTSYPDCQGAQDKQLARKGLRIFRFCVMRWKDEREPTIKYCLGRQVDVAQKFITIQSFWTQLMVSQWNSSVFFPGFTTLQLCKQSPRVPVKNERRTRRLHRTHHLHVHVQRHLMGISRQWTGLRMKLPTRFDLCKKIFTRKMVHSLDWDQKRSGILLMKANHKENGTESQSWWWSNSGKADTQSSETRVHCPRGTLESKRGGKIINTLLRWWGERLKLFFRNQLSIYGAVSDMCEGVWHLPCLYREICYGRRIWPIVCAEKLVDEKHLHLWPMILRKKIICKSTKNECKGCHNKIVWLSFVLMQDSWQRLTSDSTLWQKTLKNSHNLQSQWVAYRE